MRRTLAVPAFALAALVAAAPVVATSYVMVPDEALVDQAQLVVVGRVVAAGAAASGAPATEYTIEIERAPKGSPPGSTLVVRVPGGVHPEGVALRIWGAPRFAVGEEALLFLDQRGDGAYRPLHLMLGAFHAVQAGERRLAVRDLSEARQVKVAPPGTAPDREPVRDLELFADWIEARARGGAAADYRVDLPDAAGVQAAPLPSSTLTDPDTGKTPRWFVFDTGGSVTFRADSTGQSGVAGGGFAQFQVGLAAWNAETQTPIDYRYGGTTTDRSGLAEYDTLNTIVFGDPNDELPNFSCTSGGILAFGGPWYDPDESATFSGKSYHSTLNADIVVNAGIACFFNSSANGGKAAEELFGHELGHTLGLAHACGDQAGGDNPDPVDPDCDDPLHDDALMRAFIHDDARGASLRADDRAGIRGLYKAGATAPSAPTGLLATALSTSSIHLQWTDTSTTETGFEIEMRTLDGAFALIATTGANATSADVTGLAAATHYIFRVRAVNAAGASGYSNQAGAATDGPIAPCVANGETLCLHGTRFKVTIAFDAGAFGGAGHVVPGVSSITAGLFWFFAADNWEVLFKVTNSCSHPTAPGYWVFWSAGTDVELIVTVVDTATGKTKVYFNPLGTPAAPVQDTSSFATCP